jgi:hypothetical protein
LTNIKIGMRLEALGGREGGRDEGRREGASVSNHAVFVAMLFQNPTGLYRLE